ncbi:AAA family ATPase [Curtobacterium sp. SGAir0471]|uniref:AAA family ATPase n=1 Tax=Curtobacterium sp. SGAir0471 TaxID=2070337 RepID=UPI0015863659|nr:AAA family ATPase [Curtobacterium sp. SGAir0471]
MLLKTLYVRFYKSFNYDYLRKSDPSAVPDPWDILDDSLFYPFVRIPMEKQVTTVVGANESGKSQLLSAIKCLLTGRGIERRDFCRYSDFFSVGKEMANPEFGAEFGDLADEDAHAIRSLIGLDADTEVKSFWLFRFNKRTVIYVTGGDGDLIEKTVTAKMLEKVTLPTFFEIDAQVPLPDSVPIDYLIAPKSSKTPRPRSRVLGFVESLIENPDWFKSTETVAKAASSLTGAYPTYESGRDDEFLISRLELAEKLLLGVAGIDKSAFEELREAVKTSEGYANGLVDKMNERLADALNFPKWWSQDSDFSLYLTLRDFDLVFTVRDRTGSDYSFSERSGGMSYFLSYFVQYLSHKPTGGQETLLMDEPDAYLSMLGQQDLLAIFSDFAAPADPDKAPVQIVYVTHSPFLIDKNHGERIRVLEKGDGDEGTRVVSNAARNHYEPLRSAFGAFVAETTFIGNCNLMLEGQADQVLLAGLSSLARRLGSKDDTLDLNTLSLVPAGSAEHIPYMVYLARGRDVDTPAIAVLLDSDTEGQNIAAELKKGYRDRRLIDDNFIISIGELDTSALTLSTDTLQETEDLIPAEVAVLAIKRFAEEVLSADDAATLAANLRRIEPNPGQKLFKAAEAAAKAASPHADRPLRLDKVGFARAILEAVENDASDELRTRTLNNFAVLFRRLDKAQRDAMRKNNRDRTSKILNRLRKNFIKDHPKAVTRRDVEEFLDTIVAQLIDTSPEAETVRDAVRRVRADFDLHEEPHTLVDDYDGLVTRLEALVYEPVRQVQDASA